MWNQTLLTGIRKPKEIKQIRERKFIFLFFVILPCNLS